MQIQENISLKPFNTVGVDVSAHYFSSFSTVEELEELVAFPSLMKEPMLVLGGGSNILFTKNYEGLVTKNELNGIDLISEDESHYYLKVAAGENWHRMVLHCIANNHAGVENLSLIPGNVGASPMQNIGAYGVEIKDVFESLEAYHIHDKTFETFNAEQCEFGYRESVFKRKFKNQFIITSVTFKLNKVPSFKTSYGAIQQELDSMGIKELSIEAISQAVINIRSSKLPDPAKIGNAGSFFKNPTIAEEQFEALKKDFPTIVGYALPGNTVKVAAGWLIEQTGFKGYRRGDAGCHEKQALVLVNYGNAQGAEILDLSSTILSSVKERFGITLEREVNII